MTKRLKLKAGRRAFAIMADQAIGNDLLRGLIELITNSDESYVRLGEAGIDRGGRIEIEVDRRTRTKQTVVDVVDYAEGMDEKQMERCVASYGEDTSGKVGRGVFGMGLKDTINAFGKGVITSFREGFKFTCRLSGYEDLEIEQPKRITKSDSRQRRNTNGGTTVEIVVENPKVRIPQIETLRQQLQTHVCLRSILKDSKRLVTVRDLRRGTVDELHYKTPEGKILVENLPLSLSGYPNLKAALTVYRASGPEPLSQGGSYRTGGILITSKRTCHESTLFGFDDDPYASRLFGELRCDEIYDLQAGGEQIVDKNRNGLRKDHPLTKELFEAAKKEIQEIVAREKEEEKQRQKALEDAETAQRFRDAVRNLNQIAKQELQLGGPSSGTGPGGTVGPFPPGVPNEGFEFMPDGYRILVAEREHLKLRILVDGTTGISVGDRVEITCDNPEIRILDNTPSVPDLFSTDPPLATVKIPIEGTQANAQGFVSAKCGSKSAIATVEVVSSKEQKQKASGGLFKDIRYEERPDQPVRARLERETGTIWINTAGPSVDMYFGPGGERQEYPTNQLLVAELVTELACQEIARRKHDTKILDIPPGVDVLDAFSGHLAYLKTLHAPSIHKCLVARAHRRK